MRGVISVTYVTRTVAAPDDETDVDADQASIRAVEAIERMIADPATAPALRAKLEGVLHRRRKRAA